MLIMKHDCTQKTQSLQVRMVCQDLITASAFDDYAVNEMILVEKLIDISPDNSWTVFDKASFAWIATPMVINRDRGPLAYSTKIMCSMKKSLSLDVMTSWYDYPVTLILQSYGLPYLIQSLYAYFHMKSKGNNTIYLPQ